MNTLGITSYMIASRAYSQQTQPHEVSGKNPKHTSMNHQSRFGLMNGPRGVVSSGYLEDPLVRDDDGKLNPDQYRMASSPALPHRIRTQSTDAAHLHLTPSFTSVRLGIAALTPFSYHI